MRNNYQAQQNTRKIASTSTKPKPRQITVDEHKATGTNLTPLGNRETKQIWMDTKSAKMDKGKQKESTHTLTHIHTQNSFTALEHNPWEELPSHKNV